VDRETEPPTLSRYDIVMRIMDLNLQILRGEMERGGIEFQIACLEEGRDFEQGDHLILLYQLECARRRDEQLRRQIDALEVQLKSLDQKADEKEFKLAL
jgi:hypothetical protein